MSTRASDDYGQAMVRGVLAGTAGTVVARAIGLAVVPLLLSLLGLQLYGVWIVASLLIGSQSVIDLGLATATARFVAEAEAAGDRAAARRVVWLAVVGYCIVDLVFLLVVLAAVPVLPSALHVAPAHVADARALLLWSVPLFALSNITLVVFAALQGLQRLAAANAATVAGQCAYAAVLVAARVRHAGVAGLVAGQFALYLVPLVVMTVPAARQLLGRSSGRIVAPVGIRALVSFGGRAQFVAVVDLLVAQLPKLAVGTALGASAAGALDLAGRLPWALASVVQPIVPPTLPAASRLAARGQWAEVASLHQRTVRYVAAIAVPGCAVLLLLGPAILRSWVGPVAAPLGAPVRLLAVAYTLQSLAGPATSVAMGAGREGPALRARLAVLTTLLVLLAATRTLGVTAVSAAVAVTLAVGVVILERASSTHLGNVGQRAGSTWERAYMPVLRALVPSLGAAAAAVAAGAVVGGPWWPWIALLAGVAVYVPAAVHAGAVTETDLALVLGARRARAVTTRVAASLG